MTSALFNKTQQLFPEIDKALRQTVSLVDKPGLEELHFMLSYQMGWVGEDAGERAQGKRIRPLLLTLTAGAAGGDWERALPAAAAVELIHNFSLIHDDIEDNSSLRRGRPTVWKKWGIPQAINTGDNMFALANLAVLRLADTTNIRIAFQASKILQHMCRKLTEGQFLDLSFEDRTDLGVDDYFQMIEGKTAALIGACCELGALIAEANDDKIKLYRNFGRSLGLAFQIQDDLLGIWGDAELTGKSTTSDLLTGKKTLPVLFGLNKGGDFARRWKTGTIIPNEIPELAQILEDEGARSYTQERANHYTNQALTNLRNAQPEGEFGVALFELSDQLLNRSN